MLRTLVVIILEWIFGKIVQVYRQMKEQKKTDEGIDQKVKEQADNVKKSKTDQEDIDAAREILSRNK